MKKSISRFLYLKLFGLLVLNLVEKTFQTTYVLVAREFTSNTFISHDNWDIPKGISKSYSDCEDFGRVFGGLNIFGKGTSIYKNFYWNTNNYWSPKKLIFSFDLLKIDSWDNDDFVQIYLNNDNVGKIFKKDFSDEGLFACGRSDNAYWKETLQTFSYTIPISSNEVVFKIASSFNSDTLDESWGIKNIKIYLELGDYPISSPDTSINSKCNNYPSNAKYIVKEFHETNFLDEATFGKWEFGAISGSNKISDLSTTCRNFQFLGGFQKFGVNSYAKRTFDNLPPHKHARLNLFFFKTGSMSCNINVDSNLILFESFDLSADSTFSGTQCGSSFFQEARQLSQTFLHNASSLQIHITASLDNAANNDFWGFSNFELILYGCDATCESCGTTDSECDSCYTKNTEILGGVCTCKAGYYMSKCDLCKIFGDSTCAKCNSPGITTNCLSCSSRMDMTCVTVCPSPTWGNNITRKCEAECTNSNEYGDAAGNRICKTCNPNCATCTDTPSTCSSCSSPMYLSGTKCVNACPSPYWGNNSTRKCELTCMNNFEFGDTQNNRICVTACPSPYWGDRSTRKCETNCTRANEFGDVSDKRICKTCEDTCATCFAATSSSCLSCLGQGYLYNGKCYEKCPPPLWGNNSTRTCENSCLNTNEYKDSTDRICKACNSLCKTCNSSPSTCTSCDCPFYLSDSSCEITCPSGKLGNNCTRTCDNSCANTNEYGDPKDRICKTCDSTCATCSFPGNSRSCVSCNSPRYLSKFSSCEASCPYNYWGNNSTRKCEDSCTNSNEYGDASDNRICKTCHETCATCTKTFDSCLTCKSPFYLSGKACVDACPSPFWGNNSTRKCESNCTNFNEFGDSSDKRTCKPCDTLCKTCNNSSTNCTSCNFPSYLSQNSCKPCNKSEGFYNFGQECKSCNETINNCKICLNSTHCEECISGMVLYFNSSSENETSKCIKDCPPGFFNDSGKCSSCAKNCLVCAGPTHCLRCNTTFILYNTTCNISCADDSFYHMENETSGLCKPCNSKCGTCFGPSENSCSSCKNNENPNLVLLGTSCIDICEKDQKLCLNKTLINNESLKMSLETDVRGGGSSFVISFSKNLKYSNSIKLSKLLNVSVGELDENKFSFSVAPHPENSEKMLLNMEFYQSVNSPTIIVNISDKAPQYLKDENNLPVKLDSQAPVTNISVPVIVEANAKNGTNSNSSNTESYSNTLYSLSSFIIFANVFSYALNVERISTIWNYFDAIQTVSLLAFIETSHSKEFKDFIKDTYLSHADFISFFGKTISKTSNTVLLNGKVINQQVYHNNFYSYLGTASFSANGFQAVIFIIILIISYGISHLIIVYYQRKGDYDNKIPIACQTFKDIMFTIIVRSIYFFISLLSLTSLLQMAFFNNPSGAGNFFAVLTFLTALGLLGYVFRYVTNKEEVYSSEEASFLYEPLLGNIDLDDFFRRNHHLFILIRKILTSILIVGLKNKPIAAAALIFILYLASIAKNIIRNPFKEKKIFFLTLSTDSLVAIISIILITLVKNDSDMRSFKSTIPSAMIEKQASLCRAFIAITLLISSIYFVIALLLFVFYACKHLSCFLALFTGEFSLIAVEEPADRPDDEKADDVKSTNRIIVEMQSKGISVKQDF